MSADAQANTVLQHQFDTLDQQRDASTLGMWAFVAQEVMFFGGLFVTYLVYRFLYPAGFHAGSRLLDVTLGGTNTAVLIASSFTMAMAVWASQTGKRKALVIFLCLTLLLGCVFLGIKAFEYHAKWVEHHVPGLNYHIDSPISGQIQMFLAMYFVMTGMHALHMIVGIGLLLWYIPRAAKGRFTPEYSHPVELFGLYWHFVDIIWIFLFPLLYLLGRY